MTVSSTTSSQNPIGALGIDLFSNPVYIFDALRAPTSNDVFPAGTGWQDNSVTPPIAYHTTGGGVWNSGGSIVSIPVTVSQGGTGATSLTDHGVLVGSGTSPITALAVGATGEVLIGATGADPVFGALGVNSGLTDHGVLLGQGNSAFVATAVGATGTVLAGSTGADPAFTGSPSLSGSLTAGTGLTATTGDIVASAGNISATLGSVTAGTSITAGTTLTATLGSITATNGNLVLGTAGNKLSIATGANASLGVSEAMTAGTVTISTTAVTADSLIQLTSVTPGGTQGELSYGTIIAGTSFVITSSSNTDTSTVFWWIVN